MADGGTVHVAGTDEDADARRRMLAKYATSPDDLVGWGRSALVVAVDLESGPKRNATRRSL